MLWLRCRRSDELIDAPLEESSAALISPLAIRGFTQPVQSAAGFMGGSLAELPVSTTYQLTDLGRRFLESLRDPELDA